MQSAQKKTTLTAYTTTEIYNAAKPFTLVETIL